MKTWLNIFGGPLACAVALLCLAPAPAVATIIIDDTVESTNSWANTNAGGGWTTTGFGFVTPGFQEGTMSAFWGVGDSGAVSKTGGYPAFTLSLGTYTIEFAVGKFSNFATPIVADVDFTGMDLADATSASTPAPPLGGWALWTITWDVTAGNPNLGDPLTFAFELSPTTSNGLFDGVGPLSANGDGFLVDFEAAVPEPATWALAVVGLAGLGAVAWRRRKIAD